MTTKQLFGTEVLRPSTTPLKSSILDHATVKTTTGSEFGLRNNKGLWPSYNCMDTFIATPMCPEPALTDTGAFKEFAAADWQPAFEFAAQGGVQCSTVGLDEADQLAEIKRVFEANEGKGIEEALLNTRFVETDSDALVQWDAPVDVTPATEVPLYVALALLEGYAATTYAGVPTIHMPRAAAMVLGDRIVWENGLAYTRSGSKIAMGGGYDAEALADGDWTIYATGEVYIERSEEIAIQAWQLAKSLIGSDEPGISSNTVMALVERMFRVSVDCFVAQATGKVW